MKAVLYNDTRPYYGIHTVPLPIPPEERDQIIRRLESLSPSELEHFQNAAARMKPSNIADLRQMFSSMDIKKGANTISNEKELIITKTSAEWNDLYLKEVTINLGQMGFTTQPSDPNLEVSFDGRSLCRVTSKGGVRYREAEINGEDRQAALDKVVDVVVQTTGYMRQMEAAPRLEADSLKGDYRLLAEFNNTVLAGHPTEFGVQFITWERVHGRTSLWQGEYYSPDPVSYAAAKQGFAIRSGLIPKSALFSPEQLAEVYRSVHETLHERESLTDQRRELLEKAAEQIEDRVPDLAERVNLSNQQELELGLALNGTDGTEDGGMQFC